ncbi:unnamed protein product [Vicia faba]|uniref:Core Histone H2A/H2B/H3 domain-containing protein n=1 Tax=Vicia faba TaxID=3906 RepID=A0AAV1B0Z5_VICFA|nr:unnamed protein product [Vicia faba]
MARKSDRKMVVKSTKKVVEESVQVSVISSNKRLTRTITISSENKNNDQEEQNRNINIITGEMKKSKTQKGKKKRKKSVEGYQRYVYKVLKQVHPEMGVSSKCMVILNNFMNDMFERLACEDIKLKDYTGNMTFSSREIQGAFKLVFPGELGKHAIAEGIKAVNNYTAYESA